MEKEVKIKNKEGVVVIYPTQSHQWLKGTGDRLDIQKRQYNLSCLAKILQGEYNCLSESFLSSVYCGQKR